MACVAVLEMGYISVDHFILLSKGDGDGMEGRENLKRGPRVPLDLTFNLVPRL